MRNGDFIAVGTVDFTDEEMLKQLEDLKKERNNL